MLLIQNKMSLNNFIIWFEVFSLDVGQILSRSNKKYFQYIFFQRIKLQSQNTEGQLCPKKTKRKVKRANSFCNK